MTWIPLIATSIVASAAAVLLQRDIQTKNNLNSISLYLSSAYISSTLLIGVLIFVGLDTRWELIPVQNLILSTILWALSNLLLFYTLKQSEASTFSILFSTRVIWSIVIAVFFLDEGFSNLDVIATLIMLIGTVITVYERKVKWDIRNTALSLIAAFFFGAAVANDGIVLANGYNVPSYFLWAFLSPAIIISVILPSRLKASAEIIKNTVTRYSVGLLSSLYVISSMTLFLAFQSGQNLSLLTSLNQSQTVLIVIGAILLLNETAALKRKLTGAIVTSAGAVLLTLF